MTAAAFHPDIALLAAEEEFETIRRRLAEMRAAGIEDNEDFGPPYKPDTIYEPLSEKMWAVRDLIEATAPSTIAGAAVKLRIALDPELGIDADVAERDSLIQCLALLESVSDTPPPRLPPSARDPLLPLLHQRQELWATMLTDIRGRDEGYTDQADGSPMRRIDNQIAITQAVNRDGLLAKVRLMRVYLGFDHFPDDDRPDKLIAGLEADIRRLVA